MPNTIPFIRSQKETGTSNSSLELTIIDALIAEHVTSRSPEIHWEDSCSGFQYESFEEALEAVQDPSIYGLFAKNVPETPVLEKVRTYPAYSTELRIAFQVVEAFGRLRIRLQRLVDCGGRALGQARR